MNSGNIQVNDIIMSLQLRGVLYGHPLASTLAGSPKILTAALRSHNRTTLITGHTAPTKPMINSSSALRD